LEPRFVGLVHGCRWTQAASGAAGRANVALCRAYSFIIKSATMSRLKPKQQVPLCLVVIGIITAVLLASSCQSIHIPATRKPGDIISSNIVRRGDHARRSFLLSEMTYKSSVWIAHSGPQRFQDPRTVEEQPGLYSQSDNCNVCLTVSDTDYAHEGYFVVGKLYLHEVLDRQTYSKNDESSESSTKHKH